MLLLVSLVEGVFKLASADVHFSAHCVRGTGQAGVFPIPPWLTPGGRLVLDQPFLDQTVSRRLKDV